MPNERPILNNPQTDPAQGHAPTSVVAQATGGISVEIYDGKSREHVEAVLAASSCQLPFDPERHSGDAEEIRGQYIRGERPGFNGQVWRAVGLMRGDVQPLLPEDSQSAVTLIVVNDDYASFVARNRQWDDLVQQLGHDEIQARLAESAVGLPFEYGANVAIVGSVIAESSNGPVILDQWRGLGVTNEPNCLAWTVGESLRASDDLVDGRFDIVRSARRCLRAEWGFEGDDVAVSPISVVVESTGNVALVIAGRTKKHFSEMVEQIEGVGRNQRKLQLAHGTAMETLAYFGTPVGTVEQALSAYVDPIPAEQIVLTLEGDRMIGRHGDFGGFPMSPPQQMSSRPPAALGAVTLQHGPRVAESARRAGARMAVSSGVAVSVETGRSPG